LLLIVLFVLSTLSGPRWWVRQIRFKESPLQQHTGGAQQILLVLRSERQKWKLRLEMPYQMIEGDGDFD